MPDTGKEVHPIGDVYLYRRMEVHLQYIILLPDVLPNGDRPAAKHIVRFQYTFIIQINVSVSIQPLEHKLHILFPHHVGSKSKASFINPVFLVNPLQSPFVQPENGSSIILFCSKSVWTTPGTVAGYQLVSLACRNFQPS